MSFKAAVIQMISGMDIDENILNAGHWLDEAARQEAEIAVLPENFAVFSVKQMVQAGIDEKEAGGKIRSFLSDMSKKYGIWIVAGTIPSIIRPDGSEIDGKVRSVCRVYSSDGEEVSRYDKIHLFDADVNDEHSTYRESNEIEGGDEIIVADTPFGKIGLAVCYDVRFGELFIKLVEKGAEIITLPSAFTKETGDAHWEPLVRARSIETQAWFLAANQGGQHTKRRVTSGSSMIIDPWGKVKNRLYSGEGVIVSDIDLDYMRECRKSIPVSQHRKIDIADIKK